MSTEELSQEEEHHLYTLSGIPAVISIFLVGVYFVFLMRNNLLKSILDVVIHIGIPLAIIPPLAIFSTFELLYSRKIQKPLKFKVKRFLGQMIITLMVTLSLLAFFGVLFKVVSLAINEWSIFLYSFVLWILIWFLIVLKFKQTLSKFAKGQW